MTARPAIVYALPFALLAAAAAAIVLHGRIVHPDPAKLAWDHYNYVRMAEAPFSADPLVREPPFVWRLLPSLIVYAMPLPVPTGFWVLTLAGITTAIGASMWFLRGLGISRPHVVGAACAFVMLGPATALNLWDYMLTEPLSFALLALAPAFAVYGIGPGLFVAVVLMAATKETFVLSIVFTVAWALEHRDRRMIAWSVAASLAAVAVAVAIRVYVPSGARVSLGPTVEYEVLNEIRHNYAPGTFKWVANLWMNAIGGAWNALLPLAALQLIHPPRIWRSPAFLITLLVSASQIIIAYNAARIVVHAFPVVLAACAFEAQYLSTRLRIHPAVIWVPVLILEVPWFIKHGGGSINGFDAAVNTIPVLLAVIAVGAAMRWRTSDAAVA